MSESKDHPLPNISESYHRARKSYGFSSALLILWEIVGIEIDENPIENFNFTFQSPDAIPFIIITLVIYFGYRYSIEYHNLDKRRRISRPLIFDYITAHSIGVISILIYGIQKLYDFQIFEIIQTSMQNADNQLSILAGALLGIAILSISIKKSTVIPSRDTDKKWKKIWGKILLITYPIISIVLTLYELMNTDDYYSFFTSFVIGLCIPLVLLLLMYLAYRFEPDTESSQSIRF